MKRVLEVNVDDKGYGGVFAFVMNVMSSIDHSKFVLDIAAFEPFEKEEHKKKIHSYGGEVYECQSNGNFISKQWNTCCNFYELLKKQRYNSIHIHSDVAYKLLLYGLVGRMAGVDNIIVHSHSSGVEGRMRWLKSILQQITKPILSLQPFTKLACSKLASQWMYVENVQSSVHIITNGIHLDKFRYNHQKQFEIREKLGIGSVDKVIGTVARFSFQKYPEKLLRVYDSLLKRDSNYKLLWVGEGPLKEKIVSEAKKMGIDDKIIFYGISDRVYELYQAMDVFVMTSRFEGLGIVILEAQAAGCSCVCSNVIPLEVIVSDEYATISIEDDDNKWSEKIEEAIKLGKHDSNGNIRLEKYDINHTVTMLESFYLNR